MNKAIIFSTLFLLTSCLSAQKDSCNYTQEGKNYIGRSTEECEVIDYKCAEQWKPFEDECGCGCYEMDLETYINEILEEEPKQADLDISGMTPYEVIDGNVKITFYLQANQKMESTGNEIKFYNAGIKEGLPLKLFVQDMERDYYTISGSGCSISKEGLLFSINKWNSSKFKLLVSIRDEDGGSMAANSFTVTLQSE
ncbi:MAG: hypothetical protein ABJG68_07350 [Crocinitomicaceae bacterium]